MAEPATSLLAFFSISKIWSIIASVCGSIIPVMALADNKVKFKGALFMAISGSSFAIFIGPWIADYFQVRAIESIAGLCWVLGAVGVYVIRAILGWLDSRGILAIDRIFSRAIGEELSENSSTRSDRDDGEQRKREE